MLAKRVIPCLDIKDGRVVKGVNFEALRDAGDPVELAKLYNREGADELVFLDITASHENRSTVFQVASDTSEQVFIPFTVGGGISNLDQIRQLLKCGADKVSLNSAAIKDPELIRSAAKKFGSQCVVVAIDAKKNENSWEVYLNGGRVPTGIDAIEWAKRAYKLGAGEILLTSMDRDGTKNGYDIELTKQIASSVNIPIIASGGAGDMKHFEEVITEGGADAVLAASLFHYGTYRIHEVKQYLTDKGITIRNLRTYGN